MTSLSATTDGGPAQLTLAGDAGFWQVLVGPSAVTSTLVSQGEALTLSARGSETGGIPFVVRKQGFTLSSDAGTLAFGASEQGAGLSVPDFSDVGISVSPRSIQCSSTGGQFCDRELHLAGFSTDAGAEVVIDASETRAVGDYAVSVGAFERSVNAPGVNCDGPGETRIVGVRVR